MSLRYDPRSGPCTQREAIGLQQLARYVLSRWGGTNLGIYSCRSVRGGTSPSMHGEGRAWDWRAPSRTTLNQAIAFVIAYADKLSIQSVTDYEMNRRWQVGHGWQLFTGPGASGPTWHVERNRDGASDARSVQTILGASPTPVPTPEPLPEPSPEPEDEDEPMILPVMTPLQKSGPQAKAGNRVPFFSTQGTQIIGYNGAAISGDKAWPANIPGMTDDEASVRGLTFRYMNVPVQQGHRLIGLSFLPTGDGKTQDTSRVVATASDGATFVYQSV